MILLTGSSGFIGNNLLQRLDKDIVCFDLQEDNNILDKDRIEAVFIHNRIDTVIHLAAIPGVGYSIEHSQEVMETNVTGFDILARFAVQYKVKHFIYASSSSVYGDNGEPKSPYALSKKMNEMQAEMYSKTGDTKFTGLRFFTVYGPGIRKDLAVSKFITAIMNDEPIHVYGDGLQSRDFTYVDDVCDSIIAAMNSDKQWTHEVFDVGYGESVTVNELITVLKDILNPDYDKVIYEGEKSYDVKHTLSDTSKLYEWFGIRPRYSLRDGLDKWLNKAYKTCIATVVKNEHEYLDEWIQYHLNLGIDHMFIYEDIDSDSHKEICDKYEAVTLSSIESVLSASDLDNTIKIKNNGKGEIQILYFRRILMYLKQNFDYNWCFIIDDDEFITVEDDLNKILPLYNNYDAFIMQWDCYGANGYINKPDYSSKGVVDTYLIKSNDFLALDKNSGHVKTCYNMNRYIDDNYHNHHIPSLKCNWCRSDYSKNIDARIYKNIWIRHYITKSWEEYVWKKTKRGFPRGINRGFNYFFLVNPDMENMKNELLSMYIGSKTLVVLPYRQRGSQGNEIRLALNAWKKFCRFDYHFAVIGEFDDNLPNEFKWVDFIYCPNTNNTTDQYNPHLNIQHSMEVAMELYGDEYNGFIYMTDDCYAIKEFDLIDILTIHYLNLEQNPTTNNNPAYWSHDKWKTKNLLDKEGLPHINYTTHYPFYFEFSKLAEIWDKYDMRHVSYVPEDMYFNYFVHERPVQVDGIRLGIWNKTIYETKFENAVHNKNIKFVCNSVWGWSKELENDLASIIEGKYDSDKIRKIILAEMTQNNNLFMAGEGKLIVRKADNFIMGDCIDLGSADSIDNYEEREFTEQEINDFYKSIGMDNPHAVQDK